MKTEILKYLVSILFIVSLSLNLTSCDETSEKDNQTNETETLMDTVSELIDIPAIIKEESNRNEIDSVLIAIDVFASNSAQNEQVNLLNKLFTEATITNAEASEVFDSHNIVYKGKEYCAVVVYEQNDMDEFVIHTIFIGEGLFSVDILGKIFS